MSRVPRRLPRVDAIMYTSLALACSGPASAPDATRPGPPAERQSPSVRPPAADTATLERADLEAWLDGYLPYALQRGDVAGAVVVVVKDGAILLQKGYGYADVEARVPVDPRVTLFRPGSISKLFTWTAVMQQVEQGKLDLDRDVNAYLDFTIPDAFGHPLTLRDCMTHTSGFEEVNKNVISDDSVGIMPLEAFLKDWVPTRIFPPGRVPAYSNYATALAGYLVQRVSGEPFADYVARHIFAPLGMEHSTYRQPLPAGLVPYMAKGYDVASGDPKPFEVVIPAPAGSLSATGEDMGRFMIAHLQDGRYGGGAILRPETARLMHTTAVEILPAVNHQVLGFYQTNINGRRAIAHGGDTYLFHSDLHLFIDDGIGIYVSLNSAGKDGASGPIRTALFERFANRYLSGDAPAGRVEPRSADEHARLLAGAYESSRRSESNFLSVLGLLGAVTVTVNDDTTISVAALTRLDGQPKRWRERAPFVWREVDGENLLSAKLEGDKVVMFSGDEVAPFIVFLPMRWWRSPAWLVPLLGLSLGALLLQLALWPIAALVRRRYRVPFPLAGRQAAAHRWMRAAAAAVLLVLVGWGVTVAATLSDLSVLTSKGQARIWALQLLSLVVFVGAAAVAVWQAWVVWSGKRRWPARAWSVVLAVACVAVLYVALVFKLIAFDANY
jgi:CubicO group peptidase (beta-lactamase class C family)